MKKHIITLALLFSATIAMAQGAERLDSIKAAIRQHEKAISHLEQEEENYKQSLNPDKYQWHKGEQSVELKIGVGLLQVIPRHLMQPYTTYNWTYDIYCEPLYATGATYTPDITASYAYRFCRWFWMGASVGYAYSGVAVREQKSDNIYMKNDKHLVTALFDCRFTYLTRPTVSLYSTASFGAFCWINATTNRTSTGENGNRGTDKDLKYGISEAFGMPFFHITYIGVQFGRNVYGKAELGYGIGDLVSIGIGYKF